MKKLVLITQNYLIRERVKNFCFEIEGVELEKVFSSVETALTWLKFNDIDYLLIDFFLYEMDGLELLRKNNNIKCRKVLISPWFRQDITQQALHFGAQVIKDNFNIQEFSEIFHNSNLAQTLKDGEINEMADLETKIANLCFEIGISPHVLGYRYLKEAIRLTIQRPEYGYNITKELYPKIAETFNTTASKVERAIRHSLDVAAANKKLERINKILNASICSADDKVTGGQFIAMVADRFLCKLKLS